MRFHSTNGKSRPADFKEVLMRGIADDGGLFMPDRLPLMPIEFIRGIKEKNFEEIAFEISRKFITDIPTGDLKKIIRESFDFSVPVRKLGDKLYVLELWHGPTLAFKDFGARFMARLMNYYISQTFKIRNPDQSRGADSGRLKKLNIIVATSGDTGSAVASGFYGLDNVNVFVLYPSGRVTDLQEKQMATLGRNITAIEVRGSFDDCQRLAKAALNDPDLRKAITMSSANSINFGRLLPQSFYYWFAYAQMLKSGIREFIFCVPSGNFGNLTAGLIAKKMGMDVPHFIAATNSNDVFPRYLRTGKFVSRVSRKTISNAMDVGNPSNFARILEMFGKNVKQMRKTISAAAVSDSETRKTVKQVFRETKYIVDPHTAVGIAASQKLNVSRPVILLSTAHPAKFLGVIESILHRKMDLPNRLAVFAGKKKKSKIIRPDLNLLKELILKKNNA